MIQILHLVLYSETNKEYVDMYNATRMYYHTVPNVRTIYYLFKPDIEEDFRFVEDQLWIKGTESFIPGILDKTIRAFEICHERFQGKYDFLLRSNISTVVHLQRLTQYLEENKSIDYASGLCWVLLNIDIPSGVVDRTYFKTPFPSGTNMIHSHALIIKILAMKEHLDRSIIDDVALGILIHRQIPSISLHSIPNSFEWKPRIPISPNTIFFRNKGHHGRRDHDVNLIKQLVSHICSQSKI